MTHEVKVHISYVNQPPQPLYRSQNRREHFINPIPTNIRATYVIDRDYSNQLLIRLAYVMGYHNTGLPISHATEAISDLLNYTRNLSPYELQATLELDDNATLELLEVLYTLERDTAEKFVPNENMRNVMYYIDNMTKTLLIIVRR